MQIDPIRPPVRAHMNMFAGSQVRPYQSPTWLRRHTNKHTFPTPFRPFSFSFCFPNNSPLPNSHRHPFNRTNKRPLTTPSPSRSIRYLNSTHSPIPSSCSLRLVRVSSLSLLSWLPVSFLTFRSPPPRRSTSRSDADGRRGLRRDSGDQEEAEGRRGSEAGGGDRHGLVGHGPDAGRQGARGGREGAGR